MFLTREKPHLTKGVVRKLRERKWDHCDEVFAYCEKFKIPLHRFEKSISTPHLRIADVCDYWPASTRFMELSTGKWGVGFETLKQYLRPLLKIPKPKPVEKQSPKQKQAMCREIRNLNESFLLRISSSD